MSVAAELVLSGAGLAPESVAAVADGRQPVALAPDAVERAGSTAKVADQVARRRPVYGRTTGVGANHSVATAGDGLDLLRSHAGGAGSLVAVREVRAMMAVRANQLMVGASGARAELAEALVAALNAGAHPAVHAYGAIGTGDLTALAETALTLLGERPWREGSLPPVAFESGDALAFMSSSALTLGQAALACVELERLSAAGLAVASLTATALRVSGEPFAAEVHAARPHPGGIEVARRMRALVPAGSADHVQDAFGTRALPQVGGVLLDDLARLRAVLMIEMNAGSENPYVAADDVFHHGGWHQAPLAAALDGARLALLGSAQLAAGRIAALMASRSVPFLAAREGKSGLLVVEYTAASAIAELRSMCLPVTLGHAVLSLGVESHASFASSAARQSLRMVEPGRIVIAAELVAAVRAARLAGRSSALPALCEELPSDPRDRALDGDLEIAASLLDALAEVGR